MEDKGKEIMTSENERKEESVDNFPSDMIMEIAKWFSPEEAPRMSSLSKEWGKAVWSNPLANRCILFMSPDSRNDTRQLWFHRVLQNKPTAQWNNNQVEIPRLACPLQYMSSQTVRGLVCCHNRTGKSAIVSPTRGVCKMLPKVVGLSPGEEAQYHLGYDLESHVLMVLCLTSHQQLHILNLLHGKRHWSISQKQIPFDPDRRAICLHGNMFFGYEYDSYCLVFRFDLKNEEGETFRGPIGVKRYDDLVKVNDKLGLVVRDYHTGARRVWTLDDTSRTWSKLPFVIPPFPPRAAPKSTYRCLGTIATNRFVFAPSTPLKEPETLHVMFYDPEISAAPRKIRIDCPANPSPRHVEAILDFVETPKLQVH